MFFFGAAPGPRQAVPLSKSSPKDKSHRNKRKCPVLKMQPPERALMAFHDDPIFRANFIPRLPCFEALQRSITGRSHWTDEVLRPEATSAQSHDASEDDDEPGGVPLGSIGTDREMPDESAQTQGAVTPSLLADGTEASHYEPDSNNPENLDDGRLYPYQSMTAIPGSSQSVATRLSDYPRDPLVHISARDLLSPSHQRYHPRPETQSTLQEEDGRRVRLAMAGVAVDEAPQFLEARDHLEDRQVPAIEGSITQALVRDHHERIRPTINTTTLVDLVSASSMLSDNRLMPVAAPSAGIHPEALPAQQFSESQLHVSHLLLTDDDALPVDDPKRSYYVADFVDNWRQRIFYGTDSRLPHIDPLSKYTIRDWRPPCDIDQSDVSQGRVDIQNIDWTEYGSCREDALKARKLLHLFGRDVVSHPTAIEDEGQVSDAATHYRFHRFHSRHRAHHEHYQLRNVLAANTRNNIFYANGGKVMHTALSCPTMTDTVIDLVKPSQNATGFRITSLAVSPSSSFHGYRSDDILLAGGFYGEYALLRLDANRNEHHIEGYVSHAYDSITTHIHTLPHRRTGALGAAFCSNDKKVRLLDVGTNAWTSVFEYEHSINCSATGPDGRLRVVVGDSNEAMITDAEKGDVLLTLQKHNQHAFSCAWAPNGKHVATGAQDGKVVVWDARNWKTPLQTLECEMTCGRSLHFTDDNALVIAESDDVVSVYDTRDWQRKQHVRFFGAVAGLAVLDGGSEMVVANADKDVGGLLVFQRSSQGITSSSGRSCPGIMPSGEGYTETRRKSRARYGVASSQATDTFV